MNDGADRVDVAERAAKAGAAIAEAAFRDDIAVETKSGKNDVVTQADRDAQAAVIEVIHDAFPGEPVVGEEGDELKEVPTAGPAWVVDPIDGTANFVRGIHTWGTSVATVLDGALLDTMLSVDNDVGDDSFAMLFSLSTGASPFAVATFTGDLDGFGTTDFFTDGVFFTDGNLTVTGATVIPLPAGILLLGTGIAGLCLVRKRRKAYG